MGPLLAVDATGKVDRSVVSVTSSVYELYRRYYGAYEDAHCNADSATSLSGLGSDGALSWLLLPARPPVSVPQGFALSSHNESD